VSIGFDANTFHFSLKFAEWVYEWTLKSEPRLRVVEKFGYQ
jgi:hypothetical protein